MTHSLFDWFNLIVSVVASGFIALTMFLRGNDYRRKTHALTRDSALRMIGFTLTGFMPFCFTAWWIFTGLWPNVFSTCFLVGVSCVFFTSPNVPPWDKLLKEGSAGL